MNNIKQKSLVVEFVYERKHKWKSGKFVVNEYDFDNFSRDLFLGLGSLAICYLPVIFIFAIIYIVKNLILLKKGNGKIKLPVITATIVICIILATYYCPSKNIINVTLEKSKLYKYTVNKGSDMFYITDAETISNLIQVINKHTFTKEPLETATNGNRNRNYVEVTLMGKTGLVYDYYKLRIYSDNKCTFFINDQAYKTLKRVTLSQETLDILNEYIVLMD